MRIVWSNRIEIVKSFLKTNRKEMALTFAGALLLKDDEEHMLTELERDWLTDLLKHPEKNSWSPRS